MQPQEKRKFTRHTLDIRAVAQSGAAENGDRQETVWLRDLSGEGALFQTARPDWYIPGEAVGLTICMPGAPGVHAIMRTRGIVSRVEAGRPAREVQVALQFLVPLHFDRSQDGVATVCR